MAVMSVVTCPSCGAKNRVDEGRAQANRPVCGKCGTPLPVGNAPAAVDQPIEVTDDTLEATLAKYPGVPVLVDCWAEWCPPCRMIAPHLDALARESNGRYVIAKLDVDANQRMAARFQTSSIPTLLIFKDGKLVDRMVGAHPKQAIAAKLSQHAS
jgi:thioredoxin